MFTAGTATPEAVGVPPVQLNKISETSSVSPSPRRAGGTAALAEHVSAAGLAIAVQPTTRAPTTIDWTHLACLMEPLRRLPVFVGRFAVSRRHLTAGIVWKSPGGVHRSAWCRAGDLAHGRRSPTYNV